MLTPAFDIAQSEDFIEISVKAPYTKVSDAEVYVEECEVKFYAKPYYLRLNLPGPVVEDHRAVANYDSDQGVFIIKLAKAKPGEVFEGLELLTKLLAPAKSTVTSAPVIEVITSENEAGSPLVEPEEEEFDWQIEQVPYTEPELSVEGPKYGFANQKSGVFRRLQGELHDIIDLPDADGTQWSERTKLREKAENSHFNEEHYMADFCEDDYLRDLLSFTPMWESVVADPEHNPVEFSEEEKEKMRKLPRKEYLLEADSRHQCMLCLVDILFAYAYNHRTTEGDNTVESAWTISKLSSTLSWLQIHRNLKATVQCSFRRCLTYPLYRNWELTAKVFSDMQNIFSAGQKMILKCLLDIHSLFNDSDPRYVLNDLYITDLCVWVQSIGEREFTSMAKHLREVVITKEDTGFDLAVLERACILANSEVPSEGLDDALQTLTLTDKDDSKTKSQALTLTDTDNDRTQAGTMKTTRSRQSSDGSGTESSNTSDNKSESEYGSETESESGSETKSESGSETKSESGSEEEEDDTTLSKCLESSSNLSKQNMKNNKNVSAGSDNNKSDSELEAKQIIPDALKDDECLSTTDLKDTKNETDVDGLRCAKTLKSETFKDKDEPGMLNCSMASLNITANGSSGDVSNSNELVNAFGQNYEIDKEIRNKPESESLQRHQPLSVDTTTLKF